MAEHETALLRYATRIVNNPSIAQDVVQNVFIRLFQAWEENTRPSKHLKGWLYRVTHNEAVDMVRREVRRRALHERHAEAAAHACPDGVHCGEDPVEEQRARVLEQVRRLDEGERQVLLLRLEEGLSYAEIGEITGRSEGNVGKLLHFSVKKLSGWLGKGRVSGVGCQVSGGKGRDEERDSGGNVAGVSQGEREAAS